MWYSNKHLRWLCLLSVLLLLCGCSAAETATPPATVTPTTAAMTTTTPTVVTTATSADGTTVTTTAATAPDVSPNDDGVDVFLLVGSDARAEGTLSRSDTMMLIAVDDTTVRLVSLLRDTWVTIPSLDSDKDGVADVNKLNAAYFFGGFPMLSQTILHNFGIPVDACVTVDFEAFETVVDALGGIDMALTDTEIGWINGLCDPDIVGGAQTYHLNGAQALAFSRARTIYADGDFSRQANQRQVLRALMTTAKNSDAATILKAVKAILPFIDTDMREGELIGLASRLLDASDYTVETHYSVPAHGEFENRWIDGGLGLWLTDKNATAENLKEYIYG